MQTSNNQNNQQANKKLSKPGIAKKYWAIRSKEGVKLEFLPIFETSEEGNVEARFVELRFTDEKGKQKTFTFNYLDIYMFMYFTANEELRQNLLARHERVTNYIPYDVTVQLTDEEKRAGLARRRVELPVDEITMAIARNEAWKLWVKNKNKDNPRAFMYQNNKRK